MTEKKKKSKRKVYVLFFMGVIFKGFESLDFLKICAFLKDGATEAWDDSQNVPYAYKGTEWVGYDNVNSFRIKVRSAPPMCFQLSTESQEIK